MSATKVRKSDPVWERFDSIPLEGLRGLILAASAVAEEALEALESLDFDPFDGEGSDFQERLTAVSDVQKLIMLRLEALEPGVIDAYHQSSWSGDVFEFALAFRGCGLWSKPAKPFTFSEPPVRSYRPTRRLMAQLLGVL